MTEAQMTPAAGLEILDCTVRDGSYAVDFKFTAADTALLVELLDGAGITYIEIGHGLGLGASAAGKGRAPSLDVDVLERSLAVARNARLGAFFIPGIGSDDDLRMAASVGLGFVRVGTNADEIDTAWRALDRAVELGMQTFLNLMKTYGIRPERFAEIAHEAEQRGAAGVYVVDSAGGMLPAEVADYVRAASDRTQVAIGFHGHSNLHLAVANALAALDAGARFIDTSMYGIGRSSGNVPTEVLAVVLERLGLDCGLDPLRIIELADSYLAPLAEHLHPHDMTAVALGYGRFHSSFLPDALEAAAASGVSPLRLIVALGRRDMMRLDRDVLRATVRELQDAPAPAPVPVRHEDLAAFSDPRFGRRRIGNRPEAVGELLDALGVVAAKRRISVIVEVVLSSVLDEDEVTAEFLLEDRFTALGRVRCGSLDALAHALRGHGRASADLFLLDTDGLEHGQAAQAAALLPAPVLPCSVGHLLLEHLGAVAAATAVARHARTIGVLDAGQFSPAAVEALADRVSAVARVRRVSTPGGTDGADILIIAGTASQALLHPRGGTLIAFTDGTVTGGEDSVLVDALDAYRNQAPRWIAAAERLRVQEPVEPVLSAAV